jgi:hypothetical protein
MEISVLEIRFAVTVNVVLKIWDSWNSSFREAEKRRREKFALIHCRVGVKAVSSPLPSPPE